MIFNTPMPEGTAADDLVCGPMPRSWSSAACADLPSCLFANFYSSGHDRRGGLLNLTNSTGTVGAAQVYDRLDLY